MSQHLCSIRGCSRESHCRGWCQMHYRRWLRNGDPLAARRYLARSLLFEDERDPRHGTTTGYSGGCRCDRCREANTVAQGVLHGYRPFAPAKHGTRSKYARGCRCDECTMAERHYMRRYRLAKGMQPRRWSLP